jgi:hypothetical protein
MMCMCYHSPSCNTCRFPLSACFLFFLSSLFLLSQVCFLFLVLDSVLGIGLSIRNLYTTLVGCTTMERTQLASHFLTLPWPAHVLCFPFLIGSCLMSCSCLTSVLLCFTFVSVSILVALDLIFSVHRHTLLCSPSCATDDPVM